MNAHEEKVHREWFDLPECNACNGTGWVPRDPDIGTDQECFVCNGTGRLEENA